MSTSSGRRPPVAYRYGVTRTRLVYVSGEHISDAANEPPAESALEAAQREIEARFVDGFQLQENSIEEPEAGLLWNLPHDA